MNDKKQTNVNEMVGEGVPTIESILASHGLRVLLKPEDFQILELDLLRFMLNMVAVQKAHNDLGSREITRLRSQVNQLQGEKALLQSEVKQLRKGTNHEPDEDAIRAQLNA